VSLQTVWRWEHDLRQPRVNNRERYAAVLQECREIIHNG